MPKKLPARRSTFNAYLETEENTSAQMRTILRRAVSEIDKQLRELKKAKRTVSNIVTADQLRMAKKVMNEQLATLYKQAGFILKAGAADAAAKAAGAFGDYERVLLASSLSDEAIETYMKSAIETARAGVESAKKRMLGQSYHPLSFNVYQTEKLSHGMVDRYVETALARGLSARDFAKGIRDMVDPNVRGGVSYAAMRLSRTEINNAFHATSIDSYRNSPFVLGVDWNLSTSHPEGDECDALAKNGPYDKNRVPDKPHPQCFCYITPEVMDPDAALTQIVAGINVRFADA